MIAMQNIISVQTSNHVRIKLVDSVQGESDLKRKKKKKETIYAKTIPKISI